MPAALVAATRIADTVEQGLHGRRRAGPGDAFWQFRPYQSGDAIARIDWRRSAKAEIVYIREREWAAAATVYLWRDASASMRYRSAKTLPEKFERANVLTLALAALLLRAGERVALLDAEGQSATRAAIGPTALERIAAALLRARGAGDSEPPDRPLPRHAQLVLVGDFLSPLPLLSERLHRFADRVGRGHLLQILDPAEESLPFLGRVKFEGMENEGSALISRVESLRDQYSAKLADHHHGLAAMARSMGWSITRIATDRPPEIALLALLRLLTERRD